MIAIRDERDIIMAKDMSEAYRIVTKKRVEGFDFYQ